MSLEIYPTFPRIRPDQIDISPPTVSDLLTGNYVGPIAYVQGYAAPYDGGEGFFYLDANDTSTPHNGGTVLVDSQGRRWKRIYVGPVSVRWFGARGNGVNDDTAAIQMAVNTRENVYFPAGTYKITSEIIIDTPGQILRGDGPTKTKVVQANPSANAFRLAPSATVSFPEAGLTHYYTGIEGLRIEGVSGSTGTAIYSGTATNYMGDIFLLRDVAIYRFGTGIRIEDMAMWRIDAVRIHTCTIGVHILGGSVNSHVVTGLTTAHCGTGIKIETGVGGTFTMYDHGNDAVVLDVAGNVTVIGGNIELSSAAIVRTNGRLVWIGPRILGGNGSGPYDNIPPFRVEAAGYLRLINPIYNQYPTTTPLVSKLSTSAVALVDSPEAATNLVATASWIQDAEYTFSPIPFHTRRYNSIPSTAGRGLILYELDEAEHFRDGLHVYHYSKTGLRRANLLGEYVQFSTDGTNYSPPNNLVRVVGKVNFTANAGSFTDVSVQLPIAVVGNVAHLATITGSIMAVATIISVSGTTATFRVYHPDSIEEGINLTLNYMLVYTE